MRGGFSTDDGWFVVPSRYARKSHRPRPTAATAPRPGSTDCPPGLFIRAHPSLSLKDLPSRSAAPRPEIYCAPALPGRSATATSRSRRRVRATQPVCYLLHAIAKAELAVPFVGKLDATTAAFDRSDPMPHQDDITGGCASLSLPPPTNLRLAQHRLLSRLQLSRTHTRGRIA